MTQSNIRGAQCDRVRKTLVRYLSQVCLDSQDPPMVRSGVRAPIVLGGKPSPFRCVGSNSEERLENPSDLLENSCNDHLQTSRPHTSNLQVPLAFHNSSAESTPRGFRYISSSLHCGAPTAHIQATALNVSPRPLSTVVVTIRH